MKANSLKQSEIFAFLAVIFLIGVVLSEQQQLESPPIIILSEEKGHFRFPSGSAVVPDLFKESLHKKVIPELSRLSNKYKCDSIEIIGHTDGVPIKTGPSNMDYFSAQLGNVTPGSNLDLGMMRAINVMKIFEQAKKKGELTHIKNFIPYSAGQFTLLNNTFSVKHSTKGDTERRRIEIRLLRTDQKHQIE